MHTYKEFKLCKTNLDFTFSDIINGFLYKFILNIIKFIICKPPNDNGQNFVDQLNI